MKIVRIAVVAFFGVLLFLALHAAYAKREREKAIELGHRRLENTILKAIAETERNLTRPLAPGKPVMGDLDAALVKCESFERELRALAPLPESTEQLIRVVHALRLSIASDRAESGPERDKIREQAMKLMESPADAKPPAGQRDKH